jgi:hypothetical protein
VNLAKRLWAAIQGDPVFMRRVNGWFVLFWVAMIPVSYALGWLKSVVYVSALSLWALVSGHWSAWQAARVEVTQQQEEDAEAEHPVEQRVVDTMVERTDVQSEGSVAERVVEKRVEPTNPEPSTGEKGGEQGPPPDSQPS